MQKDCQRPDFNQMLSVVWELFRRFGKINKIYIDGSNPSFIRALKIQIGEDEEYEEIIKESKSRKQNYENVVPVNSSSCNLFSLYSLFLCLQKPQDVI
jgi:hypothetical protein